MHLQCSTIIPAGRSTLSPKTFSRNKIQHLLRKSSDVLAFAFHHPIVKQECLQCASAWWKDKLILEGTDHMQRDVVLLGFEKETVRLVLSNSTARPEDMHRIPVDPPQGSSQGGAEAPQTSPMPPQCDKPHNLSISAAAALVLEAQVLLTASAIS